MAGSPAAGVPKLVWLILILGGGLRVLFFFLSVDAGGDALDRIAKTEEWLESGRLRFIFGAWPPLHFWIIGALSKVVGDVSLAGRLLSLILGIASLGYVWRLARELYGESAAVLSLLAFTFYSLHIGYCATSSAEASYLFFVLAGLYYSFLYQRTGELHPLAAGGISLTLAAGIRFEAWVIIAAMGLVLLWPPRKFLDREFRGWRSLRPLLLFGVTAGAWPAFWMTYLWKEMGHPLYFVLQNRQWVADALAFGQTSAAYRLALTPGVILLSLSVLAVLGGVVGLWQSVRAGTSRGFAWVLGFFVFVQFYQIVSGGVMAFARYSITAGALLAVGSGFGLEWLQRRLFPRWAAEFRFAVPVVLALNMGVILALSEVGNTYSDKFASISPRMRFAHYIEEVGDFLRPRLGPHDALVVDNYNVESTAVCVAAGLPVRLGERAFLAVSRRPGELAVYLRARRPKFLVYADRGTLRPVLPLPRECTTPATITGVEFRCVYGNEVYRVYELRYVGTG